MDNENERERMTSDIYILNDLLSRILLFESVRTRPVKKDDFCKECLKKEGEIEALEWISSQKDKRINELITGTSDDCKLAIVK